MKNITKRDIKVFLLGMLVILMISIASDWDSAVRGFNDGWNGEPSSTK